MNCLKVTNYITVLYLIIYRTLINKSSATILINVTIISNNYILVFKIIIIQNSITNYLDEVKILLIQFLIYTKLSYFVNQTP